MDLRTLRAAAIRGLTPGRPLRDPARLCRVGIGMVAATVAGIWLADNEIRLLVLVGAFLAAIASLMPHDRPRLVAAFGTGAAEVVAVWIGATLAGQWWIVLPIVFAGFFAAGMLRAVAIGVSMRTLVVTIVFLAFAEIGPTLGLGAGPVTGWFAVGVAVMVAAQLLPPYERRHTVQRRAIGAFYAELAGGAPTGQTLLAADRSLALIRRDQRGELYTLVQLVERGEQIAQLLLALDENPRPDTSQWRAGAATQLRALATRISSGPRARVVTAAEWPDEPRDRVREALAEAVDAATALVSGDRRVPPASEQRQVPGPLALVRGEFRPASPILHHALRLAVAGVLGELVGLLIGSLLAGKIVMAGHGFWVVVAVVLILFPDYGETFARGIGRTVGTVLGAFLGIGLSFLSATGWLHSVILLVLFAGYLIFRSCGQPWTMFFVVAWIASLTPGPLGGATRGLNTVVGCAIGFGVFLLTPTWQRRLVSDRAREWLTAEAGRLDALAGLWVLDTGDTRRAVAHHTVRARLTRLDLIAAARNAAHEPADSRGMWDADALTSTVDLALGLGRQVAILSALTPRTPERSTIADDAARLSRFVQAIADDEGARLAGTYPESTDSTVRAAYERAAHEAQCLARILHEQDALSSV